MRATKIFLPIALGSFVVFNSFSQTWTKATATNGDWTSIAASADGSRIIATSDGTPAFPNGLTPAGIYISTNSGATWVIATNVSGAWSAALSADGCRMAASHATGGGSFSVLISTNSGADWTTVVSPNDAQAGGIASSADGHALLAGCMARFAYVSTNFGASWSHVGLGGGACVAVSADGVKMFAAGYTYANQLKPGLISISTNSGATWLPAFGTSLTAWSSIACSTNGEKVVASAYGGLIYTSTNSGVSWITNDVPVTNWNCVASSADGTRLAAVFDGSPGGIYTSTNSGATWTLNTPTNAFWYSTALSADGNKLFTGARAFQSPGDIYTVSFPAQPVLRIIATNGSLDLSWLVPSTNFVLQQNFDLGTTNWTDMTNVPALNFTNLQDEVTLPMSESNAFFRLRTP